MISIEETKPNLKSTTIHSGPGSKIICEGWYAIKINQTLAQSAGTVEYTDGISAER